MKIFFTIEKPCNFVASAMMKPPFAKEAFTIVKPHRNFHFVLFSNFVSFWSTGTYTKVFHPVDLNVGLTWIFNSLKIANSCGQGLNALGWVRARDPAGPWDLISDTCQKSRNPLEKLEETCTGGEPGRSLRSTSSIYFYLFIIDLIHFLRNNK